MLFTTANGGPGRTGISLCPITPDTQTQQTATHAKRPLRSRWLAPRRRAAFGLGLIYVFGLIEQPGASPRPYGLIGPAFGLPPPSLPLRSWACVLVFPSFLAIARA